MAGFASEFGTKAAGGWGKLENIFEDRVARALEKLGMPSAQEVAALQARVEALEAAVAAAQGAAAGATARAARPARPAARKTPEAAKPSQRHRRRAGSTARLTKTHRHHDAVPQAAIATLR